MLNPITIMRPYAKAILSIALQEQTGPKWSSMLQFLAAVVREPHANQLLHNLSMPPEKKVQFLTEVAADELNEQCGNLLKVLAEYKRLLFIPDLSLVYDQLLRNAERRLAVILTTAQEVDAEEVELLRRNLSKHFAQELILAQELDPTLIGGAKLNISDRVINSSIENRLKSLHISLIQ